MLTYAQYIVMDIVAIANSMVLVHDDILDSASSKAYESHIAIVILVLHL